jgi:hypothetical protein
MDADTITSVTALLAVLSSTAVALFSLQRAERAQRQAREQELALSVLPSRLAAFEVAWRAVYDIEEKGHLGEEQLQALISTSLWLPSEVRESVLRLASGVDGDADFSILRRDLVSASGSERLDGFLDH